MNEDARSEAVVKILDNMEKAVYFRLNSKFEFLKFTDEEIASMLILSNKLATQDFPPRSYRSND